MIKIITAFVAVLLAGGTAYGVTQSVSDKDQRVSQETGTSSVVPYGDDNR